MFLDLIIRDLRCHQGCSALFQVLICFVFQISPFILNTVMTITAAMRAKTEQQKEEVKLDTGDLWSVSNIYNCNYWFLGVEEATEVTENFREASYCNEGENFSAQIKVPHRIFKMIFHSLHLCHILPPSLLVFLQTPYRFTEFLFPHS